MAKKYEYTIKNVYNLGGELHSVVDSDIINAMAEEGWELQQVLSPTNSNLNTKYTEAIFRREK